MTSIPGAKSAAPLILQRAIPVNPVDQKKSGSQGMVAVINGVAGSVGVDRKPAPAQSDVSETAFTASYTSVAKMKLDLIERTGEALGVHQKDYKTRREFISAMKSALVELRRKEGEGAVVALGQYLGLDELGVTVDDVIDGATDPRKADKLTKALELKAGKLISDDDKPPLTLLDQPDDIGLYGLARW